MSTPIQPDAMFMAMQSPWAIHVDQLAKQFRRGRRKPAVKAVDNVSFQVEPGVVFGFLGHNGAGKTTTIKMICGLIRPDQGQIWLNGTPIGQHRQAMTQIGAVLEGTRNVYWRLSALENVLYFGRLKGTYGKRLKERAERLLTELGLWDRRKDRLRSFSRGMQQKVAIACALVADPPILLLDEPTLGLDVEAAHTIKQWIKQLAEVEKKTILLTTHHLDMAESLCDRIAIMSHGRMVADEPTRELISRFHSRRYRVRVAGDLSEVPVSLAGFAVEKVGPHTVLDGELEADRSVYAVLDDLKRLNVELESVEQIQPDLEDVFIQLMRQDKVDAVSSGGHVERAS